MLIVNLMQVMVFCITLLKELHFKCCTTWHSFIEGYKFPGIDRIHKFSKIYSAKNFSWNMVVHTYIHT